MKDMILARIISKMDFRENACEWSLSGFINEVSQIYTRHKTWSIWDITQQKSNLMVWNRSRRKLYHLISEKSFNITNSRVRINKNIIFGELCQFAMHMTDCNIHMWSVLLSIRDINILWTRAPIIISSGVMSG